MSDEMVLFTKDGFDYRTTYLAFHTSLGGGNTRLSRDIALHLCDS